MVIKFWFSEFNGGVVDPPSFDKLLEMDDYNDIIGIDCSDCKLKELPRLPNSLMELNCNNNLLKELPELPNSLMDLHCGNNMLKRLPELPSSLRLLACYENNLIVLPKIPNSVEHLYCGNNKLKLLPKLPNGLNGLSYYSNCLTFLPKLPPNFKDCFYNRLNNPVDDYIHNKCDGKLEIYYKINQTFANKIGAWFLECKYNPKYKYCRDRVDKEYDKLF